MTENEITERIIGCAVKVHQQVGPGLLASAYTACLEHELLKSGLKIEREKPVTLCYEDLKIECTYRLDLMVDRRIIVELKSVNKLEDIHVSQLITHLNSPIATLVF